MSTPSATPLSQIMASFFEPLDALAAEVIQDNEPTRVRGLPPIDAESPMEMAYAVHELLGYDDLDLFADHQIEQVCANAPAPVVLGTLMICCLRVVVFSEARDKKIGNHDFSERMIAISEYWAHKLFDRWVTLRQGKTQGARWLS